ncbi:hypothetical protein NDU88_001927 [Pleurodeles waltl]|uniref:Reverse transcriptase domain-containing protein n=1 Tax=Pleurodeles waltl TaxID=8319 RepID=A0AAV7UU46_PLEWA|nr:hypothetical protein NDU88_001927 [Pleurodeles waltl]
MPPEVWAFEEGMIKEVEILDPTRNTFRNLMNGERKALDTLGRNSHLVTKPADKGSAIVMQGKDEYRKACLDRLQDERNYVVLQADPTSRLQTIVKDLVNEAADNEWITRKDQESLIASEPRMPPFYTIPKKHKERVPPPGHLIVSGNSSMLEPLSQCTDWFLRPLVTETRSYISDTKHQPNLLKGLECDPAKETLMCLDVEALYLSIPQDESLGVITNLLLAQECPWAAQVQWIIKLAEVTLTNNFFPVEGQIFVQHHSTSMGRTFTPCIDCFVHELVRG